MTDDKADDGKTYSNPLERGWSDDEGVLTASLLPRNVEMLPFYGGDGDLFGARARVVLREKRRRVWFVLTCSTGTAHPTRIENNYGNDAHITFAEAAINADLRQFGMEVVRPVMSALLSDPAYITLVWEARKEERLERAQRVIDRKTDELAKAKEDYDRIAKGPDFR